MSLFKNPKIGRPIADRTHVQMMIPGREKDGYLKADLRIDPCTSNRSVEGPHIALGGTVGGIGGEGHEWFGYDKFPIIALDQFSVTFTSSVDSQGNPLGWVLKVDYLPDREWYGI